MVDRLNILRELPREAWPSGLARAFDAVWDNFLLLRPLVGYEDLSFTPSTGLNAIPHHLGVIPTRWVIIKRVDVSGSVYESSGSPATASEITFNVTSIVGAAELVIRVWRP